MSVPDPTAAALRRVVIVYETEAAAALRLRAHGHPPAITQEIAVYLAQATDLPAHMPPITEALAAEGIAVRFAELDELPGLVPELAEAAEETLLWNVTDGTRYYRGAAVPALARLLDLRQFGAPAPAQHLCQDKFATLALAQAAGLVCPPTRLMQGGRVLATLGGALGEGPFFVKPNMLGAKLGIFADSRCATLAEAGAASARIADRYADRALVQPYLEGSDIRVSFLDTGGAFRRQLGIFRLASDPAGETGGAFMTMRDNDTLSGARDTAGGRGGFGAERPAAFVPRLADLRAEPQSAAAVAAIETAAERLAELLDLSGIFSMDFRLRPDGRPVFLEFEVCPAVTIYDFQTYLNAVHGAALGPALARAFRHAFARPDGRGAA